jgi:hypothetical protein
VRVLPEEHHAHLRRALRGDRRGRAGSGPSRATRSTARPTASCSTSSATTSTSCAAGAAARTGATSASPARPGRREADHVLLPERRRVVRRNVPRLRHQPGPAAPGAAAHLPRARRAGFKPVFSDTWRDRLQGAPARTIAAAERHVEWCSTLAHRPRQHRLLVRGEGLPAARRDGGLQEPAARDGRARARADRRACSAASTTGTRCSRSGRASPACARTCGTATAPAAARRSATGSSTADRRRARRQGGAQVAPGAVAGGPAIAPTCAIARRDPALPARARRPRGAGHHAAQRRAQRAHLRRPHGVEHAERARPDRAARPAAPEWEVKRDTHERLISDAEAERCSSSLARRSAKRSQKAKHDYLLAGLLTHAGGQGVARHRPRSFYRHGKGRRILARRVDRTVVDCLTEDLAGGRLASALLEHMRARLLAPVEPKRIAGLRRSLEAIDTRIRRLAELAAEARRRRRRCCARWARRRRSATRSPASSSSSSARRPRSDRSARSPRTRWSTRCARSPSTSPRQGRAGLRDDLRSCSSAWSWIRSSPARWCCATGCRRSAGAGAAGSSVVTFPDATHCPYYEREAGAD